MEKKNSSIFSDHDLLITLNTKFDSMQSDIKTLGDGLMIRIAKIETRLETIERVHIEVNPEEAIKRLQVLEEWMKSYRVTWKVVLALFSAFSLIIGAILGSLNVFTFLKK